MSLPADTHVHSEWSWDTGGPLSDARGRLAATVAHGERIGLPALFFTEHLDFDADWAIGEHDFPHLASLRGADGIVAVPLIDVDGYLDDVARARTAHPGIRVHTGVEFGQPHLHWRTAAERMPLDAFERINGSLHTLEFEGRRYEPITLYRLLPAADVIRRYLEEIIVMAGSAAPFTTVTHLDYAARYWPTADLGPFDVRHFEAELRAAMRAIARSGRALELNTRRLWPWMARWWWQEGGQEVTFGSDAHVPVDLALGFPDAADLAEDAGFRPGPRAEDPWRRAA